MSGMFPELVLVRKSDEQTRIQAIVALLINCHGNVSVADHKHLMHDKLMVRAYSSLISMGLPVVNKRVQFLVSSVAVLK